MIYLSRYCKIKPQHTAPLIVSDIKKLLAPLPNRYTRGEYSVPVNTTAEQYSDEYRRFWRYHCLLYTSPSPRDRTRSRMPSSA